MPAIPTTTVQKMMGAMIILISLMNPSPSGFMVVPMSGKKCPSSTPMAMAARTCRYRFLDLLLLIFSFSSLWLVGLLAIADSMPSGAKRGLLLTIWFLVFFMGAIRVDCSDIRTVHKDLCSDIRTRLVIRFR